jgi:hypothetical protein
MSDCDCGGICMLCRLHKAERERKELLAMLERLEWSGRYHHDMGPWGATCPRCSGLKDRAGHAKDCELAALLQKVRGR